MSEEPDAGLAATTATPPSPSTRRPHATDFEQYGDASTPDNALDQITGKLG